MASSCEICINGNYCCVGCNVQIDEKCWDHHRGKSWCVDCFVKEKARTKSSMRTTLQVVCSFDIDPDMAILFAPGSI